MSYNCRYLKLLQATTTEKNNALLQDDSIDKYCIPHSSSDMHES